MAPYIMVCGSRSLPEPTAIRFGGVIRADVVLIVSRWGGRGTALAAEVGYALLR